MLPGRCYDILGVQRTAHKAASNKLAARFPQLPFPCAFA